jgi:flotillin
MKSVPPLNELFNMAGLNLPEFLAKQKPETPTVEEVETEE